MYYFISHHIITKPNGLLQLIKMLGVFVIVIITSILFVKYFPHEKGDEHYPFFDGNHTVPGEIMDAITVGQTFKADYNYLNRIDISFGTYARENTHDIIFHLRQVNNDTDVRAVKFNARDIRNNDYNSIYFEPITDSKGKRYYFFLESPSSVNGNALTVWVKTKDTYHDGEFILNGRSAGGDVLFRPYYQSNLEDFFHTVSTRIAIFVPIPGIMQFLSVLLIGYIFLILLIFATLVKHFSKTIKKKS